MLSGYQRSTVSIGSILKLMALYNTSATMEHKGIESHMLGATQHWNEIFTTKADAKLGWYESDAAQTLKFLADIPDLAEATVFLPGAGTSVLVE